MNKGGQQDSYAHHEDFLEQRAEKYAHHYVQQGNLERLFPASPPRRSPGSPEPFLLLTQMLRYRYSRHGAKKDQQDASLATCNAASYAFPAVFEAEVKRLQLFARSAIVEHLQRAHAATEGLHMYDSQLLLSTCTDIGDKLSMLDEFLWQNIDILAALAHRYDTLQLKGSGLAAATQLPADCHDVADLYRQCVSGYLLKGFEFGPLVVTLSQLYSSARRMQEKEVGGQGLNVAPEAGEWRPPNEFSRQTTKYWVDPRHLLRVKCQIIKHLPVLLFGKDAPKPTAGAPTAEPTTTPAPSKAPGSKSALESSTPGVPATHAAAAQKPPPAAVGDSGLITSVYVDNDALFVYHTRLRRDDGASLVRIRWYGERTSSSEQQLFVERKVHRESWTGERSIKERAPIRQGSIDLVLAGCSNDEKLAAASEKPQLLKEICGFIAQHQMEPYLRTEYWRSAFQEASSDALRISIDAGCLMVREKGAVRAPGGWCRADRAPLMERDAVRFPYAILEVKLRDQETPAWLQDLVDSGMLVDVPKFSKYLHGVALLCPSRLRNSPHWFLPHGASGCVSPATLEELAADDGTGVDGRGGGRRAVQRVLPLLPPPPTMTANGRDDNATLLSEVVVHTCHGNEDDPKVRPVVWAPQPGASPPTTGPGRTTLHHTLKLSLPNNGEARAKEAGREQAKHAGPGPSGAEAGEAGSRPGGLWRLLGGKGGDRRRSVSGAGDVEVSGLPRAQALVRTRVEPKVFFANERTFLAWMNIAVLIMFTGLSLLSGSSLMPATVPSATAGAVPPPPQTREGCAITDLGCQAGKMSGAIIMPVAMLFMVYALWMYKRRTALILARQTVRYDDHTGPVALTLLLIAVMAVSFVLGIKGLWW